MFIFKKLFCVFVSTLTHSFYVNEMCDLVINVNDGFSCRSPCFFLILNRCSFSLNEMLIKTTYTYAYESKPNPDKSNIFFLMCSCRRVNLSVLKFKKRDFYAKDFYIFDFC